MRRWTAAQHAARRQWKRFVVCVLAIGLALGIAGGGSAAGRATSTYSGYGFDACNAPKAATLQAWLASPYRALGIYIGGNNRACVNDQLTADWVASTTAMGWNLIPIYVGLQAPCVAKQSLKMITAASASTQGAAAADDAVSRAATLGLPAGSPIYFDMEGYAVNNPACSQTVQTFVSGWSNELRNQGYTAGVYGSAASTIRDLQPLSGTSSAPDDIWIADWNGQATVFGNSYIADTFWANHQRLHQYRGGHTETYGGVTIDIDSDYLDGAVVGATGTAAPPPVPAPLPSPTTPAPAGSVGSGDGLASVAWPAGTFQQSVVVTLTPAAPTQPVPGFAAGGYGVQLVVQQTGTTTLATAFAQPLTIHIAPQAGNLAPMYSVDGVSWKPIAALVSNILPAGANAGYARNLDGSVDIQTLVPGYFALLPDTTPPPAPANLSGHFAHGSLVLEWPKSTDPSGPAASYEVTLTNQPLLSVTGQTIAAIHAFHPSAPSVYRVLATDAAGNASGPSKPIVVLPTKRPAKLPKALPAWAWQLFKWQRSGKATARPQAPRIVPSWYWRWEAWRAFPFHLRT